MRSSALAVEPALGGLERGDQHDAHDDEQRPGADLRRVDEGPAELLARVLPRPQERRGVLGDPEEEADEHERQRERHGVAPRTDGEPDRGPCRDRQQQHGEGQAQVRDHVLGEEVGVDACRHQAGPPGPVARDAEVEAAPGLADVAADRGVHEAAVERYAADGGPAGVRVAPGARADLEELERQAHEVEGEDDADLTAGLPADQPQHQRDEQAPHQQRVALVTRQRYDAHQPESAEEEDGEQAAGRLDPGEAEQLHAETVAAETVRRGRDAGAPRAPAGWGAPPTVRGRGVLRRC